MLIPVDVIQPNPAQPRKEFDQDELEQLAASMADHGLMQPITVEKTKDGHFLLIAGERRLRAAKMLDWKQIEANIMPGLNGAGDREHLVLALTENLQRSDMNPIEKAKAFQELVHQSFSPAEVAGMVNLHVSSIKRYLLLLDFEPEIQALLKNGQLPFETNGLTALQRMHDSDQRIQVAQMAANQHLSGPAIARLVKRMSFKKSTPRPTSHKPSYDQSLAAGNGHWNMLAQLGNRPKDKKVTDAAEETCQNCPLFSIANNTNCKDCPAVDLLRRLYHE